MSHDDFQKIANLLRIMFPASPRLKGQKERSVWKMALQPYALSDVTAAVMEWGRKSKFFPDIADITSGLIPEESMAEKTDIPEKSHAWMIPHIRKLAANISREYAEELRAAGLLTWEEAEKQGMDFGEWNRKRREKFPDGFPEKPGAAAPERGDSL